MTNRILDFSRSPVRLRVDHRRLIVERDDQDDFAIPLAELAVIVVAHPQVTYTHAVLSGLALAGGILVTCNGFSMPVGMMLPLTAHHTQTERFAAQARASVPMRKRLWQQLVRAKIRAQAETLTRLRGTDNGIGALADRVRSGDPSNVEARAARRYWPMVFADRDFRRIPGIENQNALLDYGYGVLRAIIARGVCAAGLHPSLGVHHHNRYDPFCLADDLMEPFRPTVDQAVAEYVQTHSPPWRIEPAAKQDLIGSLTRRYEIEGQRRTLFDAASQLASSLVDVFLGTAERLRLPEW